MRRIGFSLLLLTLCLVPRPLMAEDFLVILDLSGSMGNVQEMEPAKQALRRVMDEVQTPGAHWGLRVYGTSCCDPDTRLEIPFSRDGRGRIRDLLPLLSGVASSPMPAALRAAREEELRSSGAFRQTAIVVSDGLVDRDEACSEARQLREDGVRVLVIGLEFAGDAVGHEVLRYIAEHPDCAAGHYIRVDRPDALDGLIRRIVMGLYGLPYRLIALALALVAGYYTTRFIEFALERRTRIRRHAIPRICNALFALLAIASTGLFLGGAAPGVMAAATTVIALALSFFYLLLTAFKDSMQ